MRYYGAENHSEHDTVNPFRLYNVSPIILINMKIEVPY